MIDSLVSAKRVNTIREINITATSPKIMYLYEQIDLKDIFLTRKYLRSLIQFDKYQQ
jgi:hypothetical protein